MSVRAHPAACSSFSAASASAASSRIRRLARADFKARRAKYACRRWLARSGSPSASWRNFSSRAARAAEVRADRSSVLAHDSWAAMRATSCRSDGDVGMVARPLRDLHRHPTRLAGPSAATARVVHEVASTAYTTAPRIRGCNYAVRTRSPLARAARKGSSRRYRSPQRQYKYIATSIGSSGPYPIRLRVS